MGFLERLVLNQKLLWLVVTGFVALFVGLALTLAVVLPSPREKDRAATWQRLPTLPGGETCWHQDRLDLVYCEHNRQVIAVDD